MAGRRWSIRGAVQGILLTAAGISVALGLAEVATRALTDTPPPLLLRNAQIGNHYIPNFDDEVFTEESGRRTHLRFNRHGFRGPDWPQDKPSEATRVVVLGDSMIAALAVPEDQILTSRLQSTLTGTTSQRWQVLNFGVSASSPGQELVLYRRLASKYEPDVVIAAFFVGNDLSDSSREMDNYPRIYLELDEAGQLRQRPFGGRRASASTWLNQHSRFYVWQKVTVNRALHTAQAKQGSLPQRYHVYNTQPPEPAQRAWKLVEAVYGAMHKEMAARCTRLGVVLIPSGRMVYADGFLHVTELAGELATQFDRDEPDRRLAQICERQGLPCMSLTAAMRAAADGPLLYFNGTGHMTSAGQAVASAAIAPFVQRLASTSTACP